MIRQLWHAARPLTRQQRFLWFAGLLLIASGLVHGVIGGIAVLGGDPWDGPVSWRKPVVFALSFGLTSIAYAWVLRLVPARRWGWIPTLLFGVAALIEVALISTQTWRGQASHFNTATDFDTAVFFLMAQCVIAIVVASLIFLVWACVQFRGTGAERVAAIVGLVAILAAGYIGNSMIEVGEAHVEATGSVPFEVVFGTEGSAKLAHFLGLHGIQFLGVIAILTQRWRVTALAAAAYLVVFVSVTLTAYEGRSWLAPTLPLGVLAIAGILAGIAAAVLVLRSLRRRPQPVG